MSRRPRFPVTGYPLHVVQRGDDRRPGFFGEAEYRFYLASTHVSSTTIVIYSRRAATSI
jgi:hypothetical protein